MPQTRLGRAISLGLLSIAIWSGTLCASAAAAADEKPSLNQTSPQSAQAVLAGVIAAYGGAEKIKQHRERPMRSHGTISSNSGISSASNSYECDVLEKGDKLRIEMTMLGVPMIIGYDGKNSWTQYGDWISPNTATTSDVFSEDLKHGLPALQDALDPRTTAQIQARQDVRGKLCDVVKITAADGKSTTFFIDPSTHLILRADYLGTDHELGMKTTQTVEYYDYRPVDGTQEPFRFVQFSGTRKKSETVIKTVDSDVTIDDKVFQMPPETEIARLKDGPVVIPFEYVGNEIIIKARVNIGQEAKFIIDTGASQSVIDTTTAAAFDTSPVSTFSITAGSKAVPLSYTKIPNLGIGDINLSDVPVLITDLSKVADHPAGLIGANILRRFLVTIDYDEKKLILADPRNAVVPPHSSVIPTSPVFGATALIVKGLLDDKTSMNFLVDTGASFNNLPQSLAKPLYNGAILPVGQIFGLDGQRLDIGSIKLKTLKLGTVTIPAPTFTLAPDGSPAAAGLFNTGVMGILGNPIWAQFKTTIDYRNERIILEAQPGHEKIAALIGRIDVIDNDYLKTKNIEEALKAYEKVLAAAQLDQLKGVDALATARMAGCYTDKYTKTKESHWLDQAGREYEKASKLAMESRSRPIEGQILALWSLMYLNAPRSKDDITAAQRLLMKALDKAPMEPRIYAALGTTFLHIGKKTEAEKLLDRALVLDPANWQALWAKYNLYKESGRNREQTLVASQLQHYYPNFPDVVAIAGSSPVKVPTVADSKTTALPHQNKMPPQKQNASRPPRR